MALWHCTDAERLVLADRFALFLENMLVSPGLQQLLDLIENGGPDAPTPQELSAFLTLMETSVYEPSDEELRAMFVSDDGAAKQARPPRRGLTPGQALKLLEKLERQGAVAVNVNPRYVNLWARQESGDLFPTRIARISREQLRRVLSDGVAATEPVEPPPGVGKLPDVPNDFERARLAIASIVIEELPGIDAELAGRIAERAVRKLWRRYYLASGEKAAYRVARTVADEIPDVDRERARRIGMRAAGLAITR